MNDDIATGPSETNPLVTFAVITYNQRAFVEDALLGAFAQDYRPIEIVLSDDCSIDGTYEEAVRVVAEYSGMVSASVHKNASNLGLAGNVNRVMEIARGELIVIAGGDDISRADRVTKIVASFLASQGTAYSICSNAMIIDTSGKDKGLYFKPESLCPVSINQAVQGGTSVLGCTHAWQRKVFDVFGPLPRSVTREDVVISFRSSLLGKIAYIQEPLVFYRLHDQNINLTDVRRIRNGRHFQQLVGRHAIGNIAIHESQLADIDGLLTINAGRRTELLPLRAVIEKNLADMKTEETLFHSTWSEQIRTIWVATFHAPVRRRRVARWFLWFIVPGFYLRVLKTMAALKRARTQFRKQRNDSFWTS